LGQIFNDTWSAVRDGEDGELSPSQDCKQAAVPAKCALKWHCSYERIPGELKWKPHTRLPTAQINELDDMSIRAGLGANTCHNQRVSVVAQPERPYPGEIGKTSKPAPDGGLKDLTTAGNRIFCAGPAGRDFHDDDLCSLRADHVAAIGKESLRAEPRR